VITIESIFGRLVIHFITLVIHRPGLSNHLSPLSSRVTLKPTPPVILHNSVFVYGTGVIVDT
jgi:hypothetical protein